MQGKPNCNKAGCFAGIFHMRNYPLIDLDLVVFVITYQLLCYQPFLQVSVVFENLQRILEIFWTLRDSSQKFELLCNITFILFIAVMEYYFYVILIIHDYKMIYPPHLINPLS